MLGNQELAKSLHGVALSGRAALLALALTLAGSFAVIGSAQAQDCEGGFRMLKGEIPVACEGGFDQSAVAPVVREPAYTGAIARLWRQRRRNSQR